MAFAFLHYHNVKSRPIFVKSVFFAKQNNRRTFGVMPRSLDPPVAYNRTRKFAVETKQGIFLRLWRYICLLYLLTYLLTFLRQRRLLRCTQKDSTGHTKSHKGVIFHLLGGSPHWIDLHRNSRSSCCPQRNSVCKVLNWNLEGLLFYRGSNFRFSCWFLHGPYNNAALVISLLQTLLHPHCALIIKQ